MPLGENYRMTGGCVKFRFQPYRIQLILNPLGTAANVIIMRTLRRNRGKAQKLKQLSQSLIFSFNQLICW